MKELVETVKDLDLKQSLLEILGKRLDAPKCSDSELHDWVQSAGDPVGDSRSAAIRLCYENPTEDTIRVRLGNNWTNGQYVNLSRDDGGFRNFRDFSLEDRRLEFTLSGLAYEPARLHFGGDGRVFIPPVQEISVTIPRPSNPGDHTIRFSTDIDLASVLLDVQVIAISSIASDPYLGPPPVQAFFEVFVECAALRLKAVTSNSDIQELLKNVVILNELINPIKNSCALELLNPTEERYTQFMTRTQELYKERSGNLPSIIEDIENVDEWFPEVVKKNRELARGVKAVKAVKAVTIVLAVAEFALYSFDLYGSSVNRSWEIKLRGPKSDPTTTTPTTTTPTTTTSRAFANSWGGRRLRVPEQGPGPCWNR